MRGKYVEPSVNETRFSCPHCGTLAVQHWFFLYGDRVIDGDGKRCSPHIVGEETIALIEADTNIPEEMQEKWLKEIRKKLTGMVYLDFEDKKSYLDGKLVNISISECDECKEASIWHRDRLMHPASNSCPLAHEDMPATIVPDYNEARTIIDLSPRGAAALARLCIEKLCINLLAEDMGGIDKAIGKMVALGLDERIQKKLDIVRVNGNTLVHGGTMEDEDDRDKAAYLLDLVNQIVDETITRPARLSVEYSKLPANKLQGIKDREKRTPTKADNVGNAADKK